MATPHYPKDVAGRRGRARLRSWLVALAVVGGAVAGVPAAAQDYAARVVGGWTVTASKDKKGCFLTRAYERAGDTTLLLGLETDGSNHLSVLNANWSIKPRDRLKLNFRLSTGGYDDHIAVGMSSEGKRGFVTTFEAKFPTYFASSKVLRISRGDVPVEQLSLEGSGAAVAELRRCVWIHKAKIAGGAAKRDRPDDIPTDPFAPTPN